MDHDILQAFRVVNTVLAVALTGLALRQMSRLWDHLTADLKLKGLSYAILAALIAVGSLSLILDWPPGPRVIATTVALVWGITAYALPDHMQHWPTKGRRAQD